MGLFLFMLFVKKKYWSFFWPLTVTGLAVLLSRQFQNGALGRYPDAARELAIFAFASSIFHFCNAALIFIPQMANVLCRSVPARRTALRFTAMGALLFSIPLLFFGFTPGGRAVVAGIFGIEGVVLNSVILYLRLLSPLVIINAFRHFFSGLLIQVRRTGTVTILNVIFLTIIIVTLIVGFYAGWRPVVTLAAAQILSGSIHLVLTYILHLVLYHLPEKREYDDLTLKDVFTFFWPVAITSTAFSLSRPIIYSFISRLPNPEPVVASLRLAFDFAVIFHNPINQFRNLFITFGKEDPQGVRRFMIKIMVTVVCLMIVVAATPASVFIFKGLLGAKGEVLVMARQILGVVWLIPLVITLRNYFHGLAMVKRETVGMAVGSISRIGIIFISSGLFLMLGWLNHVTAGLILVMGFAAEATGVMVTAKIKTKTT
jgi:hypothetical protein